MSGYVVGAYAASPAHRRWDPVAEAEFFRALEADSRIAALEFPWLGQPHPFDSDWLFKNLPPRFQVIMTDIPFVMSEISSDHEFGLASADEQGRLHALDSMKRLRSDVQKLNDARGRRTVTAVEIHSAPRGNMGSRRAFAESLAYIAQLDWDGAEVVIEHCDAWRPGQEPQKGFLTLEDELQAIESAEVPFGVSINWGRSAIEFRCADRVAEHVAMAHAAGRLHGFMISGASDSPGAFGPAWIDAHHPFRQSDEHPHGDPSSLLTEHWVVEALAVAQPSQWLGVKVGWPSEVEGSAEQRASMIGSALDVCGRATAQKTE